MSKPGADPSSGISLGDALRLPKRHPACRRREAQSGSGTERENLAAYAIHQAREVMNFVHHAAGADSIFESNPFERRFRDLHTMTQQGQAAFANFEALGQTLM